MVNVIHSLLKCFDGWVIIFLALKQLNFVCVDEMVCINERPGNHLRDCVESPPVALAFISEQCLRTLPQDVTDGFMRAYQPYDVLL